MKKQEISFKCRNCGVIVSYKQTYCSGCAFVIEWDETVEKAYEDKYTEIFSVRV